VLRWLEGEKRAGFTPKGTELADESSTVEA
jgi:hypothetical protein